VSGSPGAETGNTELQAIGKKLDAEYEKFNDSGS